MANWTHNRVMLYGSEEEIKRFKAFVASEDSPFDFNRIVPLDPSKADGDRRERWGTRSNACEVRVRQDFDMEVDFLFVTAWQAPREIYQALLTQFGDRDLQIIWRFNQDPCEGRCGFLTGGGDDRTWDYDPFIDAFAAAHGLKPWEEDQGECPDEPENEPTDPQAA